MIIATWMLPAASGWRAMLSSAEPASLPMPNAAPMTTSPAPNAPLSSINELPLAWAITGEAINTVATAAAAIEKHVELARQLIGEALAWRDAQAEDDPSTDPYAAPNRRRTLGVDRLPTNQGVFVGSYATVAGMLDELAAVPGVRGVMLTFDDFLVGMEQFGTRILPLMRCRAEIRRAA